MTEKNRAMELYRFLCAVMILCYHCQWYAFRDSDAAFSGFYVFVELFFILSGFLMMNSIRRRSLSGCPHPAEETGRYIKGRVRQLLPQHLLSLCLAAALHLWLLRDMLPIEVAEAGWPELLLVNIFGFVRDQYVNIVCWYLSALVFASLLLYYLILRSEDAFVKVLAPVLLVVCYGSLFDRTESLAATIHFARFAPNMGFLRALADLTAGVLAYRAWEWLRPVSLPHEKLLATLLELSIALCAVFVLARRGSKLDFLFVPLFFTFVISVFRGKSLWTRLFDNRLSDWLGRQSYAYFLNNFVVIYPYLYFFPSSNLPAMAWFCAPVCLAVSAVTGALLRPAPKKRGIIE